MLAIRTQRAHPVPRHVGKEQFLYPETQSIFAKLEEVCQRSGVSRGQAFEDFLTASVCALAGGTMEEEYLAMVKRHEHGTKPRRGIDLMPAMFAQLTEAMEKTRQDILGDLFQGAITYGEAGQFLTPESVCKLIAEMTGPEGHRVLDPCCGSGRMLLAASEVNRNREFIGQDIDLRCVRITAINLALRNLYGHVLWGDSLGEEVKTAYRTGFNGRGFVRHAQPGELASLSDSIKAGFDQPSQLDRAVEVPLEPPSPGRQLRLF